MSDARFSADSRRVVQIHRYAVDRVLGEGGEPADALRATFLEFGDALVETFEQMRDLLGMPPVHYNPPPMFGLRVCLESFAADVVADTANRWERHSRSRARRKR